MLSHNGNIARLDTIAAGLERMDAFDHFSDELRRMDFVNDMSQNDRRKNCSGIDLLWLGANQTDQPMGKSR
jgi:hypothetical protein